MSKKRSPQKSRTPPTLKRRNIAKRLVVGLNKQFGPDFHAVLAFHMRTALSGDGFEAIWDEPKALYAELSRLFASDENAEIVIRVVLKAVKGKRGEAAADGLVRAMKANDVPKVRAILRELFDL